jgi:tetratricopeptide (TPR) repeat protein
MERKDTFIWGAFAVAFLLILYLTFRARGPATTGQERRVNPYATAVAKVDPVKYHMKRAYAYEAECSTEMALREYQELVRLNPDDIIAHTNLAALYYKLDDRDKAIAEIREVLRIDPSRWTQREILADTYYDMGEYERAIYEYSRTFSDYPRNAMGHYKLGRVYYKTKRYSLARDEFTKAIEVYDGIAEAHLGRGLSYCALGNKDGALAAIRKLRELKKEDMADQLSEAVDRMDAGNKVKSQIPNPKLRSDPGYG